MSFDHLLIVFGALLLAILGLLHRRLSRSIKPRTATPKLETYPSVTVIRPVKGLDAGAEANIQAALDHGYEGQVETIFVFDDEAEPAYPLVAEAIRKSRTSSEPADVKAVFCGEPPAGRTGKLNAMIAGLQQAKCEIIVFADSDVRPDVGALTELVGTLKQHPDAGSAFAPVVVREQPRTVGDAGYALLLNALYSPEAAAFVKMNNGELPFIMGQFMAFTRQAIEAIGGLENAEGQLVDDMYLGLRIKEVGLRNVVSPFPVPIVQYGISFGEFWSTYVRWMTFSRSGMPGYSFKASAYLRGIVFWFGLLAALVALTQGSWIAFGLNLLAPLGINLSNNRLHLRLGGASLKRHHRMASFGLLLLAPFVLLRMFTSKQVRWRGRSYNLDAKSLLAEENKNPVKRMPARSR